MIAIVSGLPRCGTSMMMQMLAAGGMPVMTDNIRQPDEDNPRGYYEFEKVKQIKKDVSWLVDAEGKVFKMISMLLYDLPPEREYKIVFMVRDIEEILASQRAMLRRMGKENQAGNDEDMRKFFDAHLKKLKEWLGAQSNIDVLYCRYRDILDSPERQAQQIAEFFGRGLDVRKMVEAVDPALYRNRASAAESGR